MSTVLDVFRKQWRLIALLLGLVIVFCLLYAIRSVIFPFVLGLVLAYLVLPAIKWAEKRLPYQDRWIQAKRIFLVLVTFIVVFGLVGLLAFYVIMGVVSSSSALLQNAPEYITQGLLALQDWAKGFRQWLPPELVQQVEGFVLNAAATLGNAIQDAFTKGISLIPTTFGPILGLISLPIFLFYVLKDSTKLSNGFYAAFSPQLAEHARRIVSLIERVLGRFIRAQLMLGLIVAVLCFTGLSILRIELAPALAIFAGLTELIPILGPWIGGAVGVIVTLAIAPEKAVWVALVYVVVQLLENTLLVPRIQGSYLRIHPAIIMVLLIIGAYIGGLWGMILITPVTATSVEIYKYVRHNIKAEETR